MCLITTETETLWGYYFLTCISPQRRQSATSGAEKMRDGRKTFTLRIFTLMGGESNLIAHIKLPTSSI